MACTLQKVLSFDDKEPFFSKLRDSNQSKNETAGEIILKCELDLLASGQYAVVAKDKRLAIFERSDSINHDLDCGQLKLLSEPKFDDQITKVTLLQTVLLTKSNTGNSDLTCFLIGFTSGFVRVCTEKGRLLFEQQFATSAVMQIKHRTYYSKALACKTYDYCDVKHENQISILYSDCLVTLSVPQFLAVLKRQLLNIQGYPASVSKSNNGFDLLVQFDKWMFPADIQNVNDFVFIRNQTTSAFDQMGQITHQFDKIQSKMSGYSNDFVLLVGINPFVGLMQANIDRKLPTFNEIAETAFGAVKQIIPFFGSSEEKPKLEFVRQLTNRLRLYDGPREGLSVRLNADSTLALISDNLGRVTLYDLRSLTVLRLWKGYRNCECAFVDVKEGPQWDTDCKQTLFVVLHAPKRQILEIWPAKFGPRVTAFNLNRHCRLLSLDHQFFGLNHALLKHLLKMNAYNAPVVGSCAFLLDCDKMTWLKIDIPFICSIQNQENSKMKDSLILKQLPVIFERPDFSADKVIALFTKTQLNANRLQFVNMLIKQNKNEVLQECICQFRRDLIAVDPMVEEVALMLQKCNRIGQLLQIYDQIIQYNAGCERIRLAKNIVEEAPQDVEIEANKLGWKSIDFTRIISLFSYGESLNPGAQALHVSNLDLSSFVSLFVIDSISADKSPNTNQYELESNTIRSKSDHVAKTTLGNFLFTKQLTKGDELKLVQTLLNNRFDPFDLLIILFSTWLSDFYAVNWKTWQYLVRIGNCIVDHIQRIEADFSNHIRHCSRQITSMILDSDHLSSAIVAACTLDTLFQQFSKCNQEESLKEDTNDEEWESLSIEKENFDWSLKQLKDTYLLNLLLHMKQSDLGPDVTLTFLRKEHSAIVCELVAKWCVEHEICPDFKSGVVETETDDDAADDRDKYLLTLGDETIPLSYNGEESEQVQQLLYHLRMRFPFSLEPDVLFANCAFYSVLQFNRNYSASNSFYLQHCVNFLNRIGNTYLKHTLACLMWNKLFMNKFKMFFTVLDQGSQDQFDQSSVPDLTSMLVNAIHFACELMELILNTIHGGDVAPNYETDEWWKDDHCLEDESKKPIVQLALNQPKAKVAIVLEHCHLLFVTSLAYNFSLDHQNTFKPLRLFPSFVQQSLFKELHLELGEYGEDELVTKARQKFAIESIKAIAKTVPVVTIDLPNEMERKSYALAMSWMSRLLTVCREWNLDIDVVRRRFIICLYETNSCVFAEELFHTVSKPEELAKELIEIAAIRVISLIGNSFYTEINKMPSSTAFWLRALHEKRRSRVKNVPKSDRGSYLKTTHNLVQNIVDRLPETNGHLKMCASLLEYLRTLKGGLN